MNGPERSDTLQGLMPKNGSIPWKLCVLLVLLAAGFLCSWWMVVWIEHEMRDDLIRQATMVAQTLNPDRVKELAGTEADLASYGYQRVKRQFMLARQAIPNCRFLYLLGRRSIGSDTVPASGTSAGDLFFYLDSEPDDSKDYSPPGQVYSEAAEPFQRVFDTRKATVVGPVTDRWGTWISTLVPVIDATSVTSGHSSPEDAQTMVRNAVAYYRQHGRERFLAEVSNPRGAFRNKDLYAFVYDPAMILLAHPVKPELVGQNQIDRKDWPGGKYFRREIQIVASSPGTGWVEYQYETPAGQLDQKITYVERADDLIVCAGAYKGSGAIVAVLGMDIDASTWKREIAYAALPPILIMLVLIGILMFGFHLLSRRSRAADSTPRWMSRIEPALALTAGLALSFLLAWLAHFGESVNRARAFEALAASKIANLSQTLSHLRDTELEGLATFFLASEHVTLEEFQRYTSFLMRNQNVQAWEWIPAVPAAERERFEQEARAAGLPGFTIWQKGPQGEQVPASGRDVYYPVFMLSPRAGNEKALGFDLGSEPLRRAALEEAAHSGLISGSDPLVLVQETASQKGMLIFRPVFDARDPKCLRGFAVAVLRLGTVLNSAIPDSSLSIEFSILHENKPPELLSTTHDADYVPTSTLAATALIMRYGSVFSATARAELEFERIHPMRAGWLSALLGLMITATLTGMIGASLRRREELERLVADRTSDLRASEANFRAFFETIGDLIFVTDATGRIFFTNSAVTRHLGYTLDELKAMHVLDVHPKESRSEAENIFGAMFRGERNNCPLPLARKDGTLFPVETRVWFGTWNGKACMFGLCKDLSAQIEAQQRFERLFHNNPALMVLTTFPDRHYLDVNAAFLSSLGYLKDEVIGKTAAELGVFADPAQQAIIAEKLQRDRRISNLEVQIRRKDGGLIYGLYSGEVITTQGQNYLLTVMVEITERKAAEEALKKARQKEIGIGVSIQNTLLLGTPPAGHPYSRVASVSIAARQIGGDFVDFHQFDDGSLDIVVGDVMGKGIPAALMGAAIKSEFPRAFNRLVLENPGLALPTPAEIIGSVHQDLTPRLIKLVSFVTLVYARFDFPRGLLSFVDCGHTKTLHYRHDLKTCEFLSGVNVPIGFWTSDIYQQISVSFMPGDMFVFYSDGITETANERGDLFGETHLEEFAIRHAALPPERFIQTLLETLSQFRGCEANQDDLTCVVVQVKREEERKPQHSFECTFPADLGMLESVRETLATFFQKLSNPPVDEMTCLRIELSVNEAVANVIEHALGKNPESRFRIQGDAFDDRIELRILHTGKRFDKRQIPLPSFDGSRDRGFGVFIIDTCIGETSYSTTPEGEQCILLRILR